MAAYVLLLLIWGVVWAVIKVAVSNLPLLPFVFERGFACSVLLTAAAVILRQPFPRDRRSILAASAVGILQMAFPWTVIGWSVQHVPTGLTAVIQSSAPVWTALLAHYLVRGDRFTKAKLVALALGLIGTVLLVGASSTIAGGDGAIASALLTLVAIGLAVAAILQARTLRGLPPVSVIATGAWAGTIVTIPLAFAGAGEEHRWTPGVVLAFFYLTVFAVGLAQSLNLWLYRHLRPTTMMLTQVILPAEAIFTGALAFGEQVTASMLAGAFCVCGAVLLNALSRPGAGPSREEATVSTPAG